MVHPAYVSNTWKTFNRRPLSQQEEQAWAEKQWSQQTASDCSGRVGSSGRSKFPQTRGGEHFLSTCCMLSVLFVCFLRPEGVVRKLPTWFLFPLFTQHWLKGYTILQRPRDGCRMCSQSSADGKEGVVVWVTSEEQCPEREVPGVPRVLPLVLQGTLVCS